MKKRALILYTCRDYFTCGQVMRASHVIGDVLEYYHASPGSMEFIAYMLEKGFGIHTVGKYVKFYDEPYNNRVALASFTSYLFNSKAPTMQQLYDMFDNPEYVVLLTPSLEGNRKIWKTFQITDEKQMQLLVQNIMYAEKFANDFTYKRVGRYREAVKALMNTLQIKSNPFRNRVKFAMTNNLVEDLANGKGLPHPDTLKEYIEKH